MSYADTRLGWLPPMHPRRCGRLGGQGHLPAGSNARDPNSFELSSGMEAGNAAAPGPSADAQGPRAQGVGGHAYGAIGVAVDKDVDAIACLSGRAGESSDI